MGELINLNGKVPLADADIPALIARDVEYLAADAAHVAAADPHPIYLTQAEGDGRYRQTAVALTDADIPAAIARDAETTAAVAAHAAAADPHPTYLTQAEGDARYPLYKKITSTTPATQGLTVAIPHGLTIAKILSISGLVYTDSTIPPNGGLSSPGYAYSLFLVNNDIYCQLTFSNSAALLKKTLVITILYLP